MRRRKIRRAGPVCTFALALEFTSQVAHAQDAACGLQGPLATVCMRARQTFTASVQAATQGGVEGATITLEGCRRLGATLDSLEVAAGSQPTALSSLGGANDAIGAGVATSWSLPDDLVRARRFCAAITSDACAPLAPEDGAALVEGAGGTVDLGRALSSARQALGRCQPVPQIPLPPETTQLTFTTDLGALVPLGDDLSRRGHGALAQLSAGLAFSRSRWILAPQIRLLFGPGSVAGTTHPLDATHYGASLGVSVMYPLTHSHRLDVGVGGEAFYGLLARSVDTAQEAWSYPGSGLLSVIDVGAAALIRWRPSPSGRWWVRASTHLDLHALTPVDGALLVGATFGLRLGVEADL